MSLQTDKNEIKTHKTIRLSRQLLLVALTMFLLMSIFQTIEHLIDPQLTTLQSHISTIIFGTAIAVVSAYAVLRKYHELLRRLSEEIGRRQRTENELSTSRQFIVDIINNIADPIFVKDRDHRFILANTAMRDIAGRTPDEIIGKTDYAIFPKEEVDIFYVSDDEVLTTGMENTNEEKVTDRHGKTRTFVTRKTLITDISGNKFIVGVARDITERKLIEEQIRYISLHDRLTGLFTRLYFEEELHRLDTARELPMSLIMADVNGLKLTNDVFGHQEGDRLLKTVANILQSSCRDEDIITRWGGDEFIIILPRTEYSVARKITSRIKKMCDDNKDVPIPVTVALGIATKNNENTPLSDVLREAEENMYKNKFLGNKATQDLFLSTLMKKVGAKSSYIIEHMKRMEQVIDEFGKPMGLSDKEIKDLQNSFYIHELGKVVIPAGILLKNEPLSPDEWAVMIKHSEAGYRIAHAFDVYAPVADAILSLHEHWDGKGYPRRLKDEKISFVSRVLLILVAFDVMTHPRPYGPTLSRDEAVAELRRNAGTQFDPALIAKFEEILSVKV
jgi:diguanylate cyclase (GGDEF)-like protein/PAS domain S-box-containing protein